MSTGKVIAAPRTARLGNLKLTLAAPLAAVGLAVVVSALVLILAGDNPLQAFADMVVYAVRPATMVDIANRAVPLYLSGVAAAIGFRMNMFNIGVEGQYQLALFVAAVVGGAVVLPTGIHLLFVLAVAVTVGAFWAGLAGLLKVARGINEVISTIMLNFVAIGGVVAALLPVFREGELTTNSGTKYLAESAWMPNLNFLLGDLVNGLKGRELSGMLLLAIAVGVGYHLFVNRSRLGFDLRASGLNPLAARAGGVSAKKMILLAMTLSGAIAGLVGMVDLVSRQHRYDLNFTPGLGFTGIAVALLGRNHPLGIALAALLFSFLDVSSPVLQLAGSSPEIVDIMQGVVLLAAVIAYETVSRVRRNREAQLAAVEIAAIEVGTREGSL